MLTDLLAIHIYVWPIMAHGGPSLGSQWALGKLGPIMAHEPIGGAQFWAHNKPWASLGPSWPMGGPSLGP